MKFKHQENSIIDNNKEQKKKKTLLSTPKISRTHNQ